MHVVVKQVLVLGEEVALTGLIVVGADQGVELRVRGKTVPHELQRFGRDQDIGVDKKENVPLCFTSGSIPRDGGPLVGREADDPAVEGGGHLRRVIGRGVIDHDAVVFGKGRLS